MVRLETIHDLNALQQFVNEHEMVLLYVSRPNCGVCVSLLPKVEELIKQFPEIRGVHMDLSDVPELAGMYTILSAPAILLLVKGEEVLRRAGIISVDMLEGDLQKIYTAYFH